MNKYIILNNKIITLENLIETYIDYNNNSIILVYYFSKKEYIDINYDNIHNLEKIENDFKKLRNKLMGYKRYYIKRKEKNNLIYKIKRRWKNGRKKFIRIKN